jgi:glutamyl-tRNA reductase
MNLLAIGVNHRTAPIDIRERIFFTEKELPDAYDELLKKYGFNEAVILSTCNRTEIYTVTNPFSLRYGDLLEFIREYKDAQSFAKPEYFYRYFASGAAHHLFRVASGIDSMVIGDIQILAQLKESYYFSEQRKASGFLTNRLFHTAFRVGKRARTETEIGDGAVSISYAAVELANKIFADLSKKRALLIGAGETGELTAKHLKSKGIGELVITNRTRSRSEELAAKIGGTVVDFENFVNELERIDIVISSVQAPEPIIDAVTMQRALRRRGNDPIFLIDIGVPRNIDPACNKFDNVFLHDIDALKHIIDKNLLKRQQETPKIEHIIMEELQELFAWYNSLKLNPTISELRQMFEFIRQAEVEKHINKFKEEDRELIDIVTKRIINKLLHTPMTTLRSSNGDPEDDTLTYISSIRKLFGLERTPHK